jgi:protein-tyrosine kinase
MTILSKALEHWRRKKSGQADAKNSTSVAPHKFSGRDALHEEDVGKREESRSAIEVDRFSNEPIVLSELDIENLDIDLSVGMDDITGLPEQNMLEINLANPFSRNIDLDLKRLESQGYLTPSMGNSHLSNTFRMIKRPILNNAAGKGATVTARANMIMLTSCVSAEGKSFSAINLAMSIAMEKNKRVLLIDADVNKPSHHQIFGVEMEYGLTDYLSGKVNDMSRILCRTNVPTLSLMFAGSLTSHATELLASESMDSFVRDISQRYSDRIIVFDSPPLLMTTESTVLASHMGQIVVVVEAEKTMRHDLSRGLSLLQNEIVLLLLNKMREKDDASNYGYYGYGHQG